MLDGERVNIKNDTKGYRLKTSILSKEKKN